MTPSNLFTAIALLVIAAAPAAEGQVDREKLLGPAVEAYKDGVSAANETASEVVHGASAQACRATKAYLSGGVVTGAPCGGLSCDPGTVVGIYCVDWTSFPHVRFCEVWLPGAPIIIVPFQSAVGPIDLRCINALENSGLSSGDCNSGAPVEIECDNSNQETDPLYFCLVWLDAAGCINPAPRACTNVVQTFCWPPGRSTDDPHCFVWESVHGTCIDGPGAPLLDAASFAACIVFLIDADDPDPDQILWVVDVCSVFLPAKP